MEEKTEELHNRLVDVITDSEKKYTIQEIVASLELIKSELIYQHLLKIYGK